MAAMPGRSQDAPALPARIPGGYDLADVQVTGGEERMTTGVAGPEAGITSADRLYLDLLKRCLTRTLSDEELAPLWPARPWQKPAWRLLTSMLARWDVVPLRRISVRTSKREEGLDWPADAETMIGLRRLENLEDCVRRVVAEGVPGDLLEAGVWRGGASIFMRGVLAVLGDHERVVWAADSFQGLPKPRDDQPADEGDTHWTHGNLAVSLEEVRANFSRYHLLDDQVRFLKGWFADTLPGAPIEHLAVLRADGDMYSSTMDILNALYPKVSLGGFVIIDDYGAIPACKVAVDEYRELHDIREPIEQIDWTGAFWRREG